jgi:hypothetical protein
MADLIGSGGVIHATITIKRAATGKEETFDLILTPEKAERKDDGTDTLDGGAGRGDERRS